jgi:hypothetical protein
MSYAALDHWNARVPIPRGANSNDHPGRAGPVPAAIRDALWARLLDSLVPGNVLRKTLEWSLILNQIPTELGGGAQELRNRTLLEWNLLKNHIDAGRPWPIGLVITGRDVWSQHQILVYGYRETGVNQGDLFVYENNLPSSFGDPSHRVVPLDFRGPTLVAPSPSGDGMVAGFFCLSTGTAWQWKDLGKPPQTNVRNRLGVVTARDTPTSAERPVVFVECDDFNLWCLRPVNGQWGRENTSKPSGPNLLDRIGAVGVMDDPTSPQRPHLFVACNDGNVWCRWSNGTGWTWDIMGKPRTANLVAALGVTTVMDGPTAPQRPYLFVTGDNGHLWTEAFV